VIQEIKEIDEVDPKLREAAMGTFKSAQDAVGWLMSPKICLEGARRSRLLGQRKGRRKLFPFWQAVSKEGDDLVLEQRRVESQRDVLLDRRAQLEQGLGDGRSLRADLIRFSDIFAALTPERKRQALQLLIRRIVVSRVNNAGDKKTSARRRKRKTGTNKAVIG
jgi:hypothetical protein